MNRIEEFKIKVKRVKDFLRVRGYKGLLLSMQNNFSWISCGGIDSVIHFEQPGLAWVLITLDESYLLSINVEIKRILDEELNGLIFKTVECNWAYGSLEDEVKKIIEPSDLAVDWPFPGATLVGKELKSLRTPFLESEVKRYKNLADSCASEMEATLRTVKPGMSEYEIQGDISGRLMKKNIVPQVLLVGTDGRLFKYRHPIPTSKKLDKYLMIVICAERNGTILSMTRFAHFGPVPNEIQDKFSALAEVELSYISETKPGNRLKDVFEAGRKEYEKIGYPGEEKKHFQGGTAGYLTREFELSPEENYVIKDGEIFAHNPTIAGVKLEDTVMIKNDIHQVLTLKDTWPSFQMEKNGITLNRPLILER